MLRTYRLIYFKDLFTATLLIFQICLPLHSNEITETYSRRPFKKYCVSRTSEMYVPFENLLQIHIYLATFIRQNIQVSIR